MVLFDTNVLIYAHRRGSPRHLEYRQWLESVVSSGDPFAVPGWVGSGFIRIVTNPRIFPDPTDLPTAVRFLDSLRESGSHVEIGPGKAHWGIFVELCLAAEAKGDLVTDAYLASLALENGAELVTTDRDFARFPGLRWRHPLDPPYGTRPPGGNALREKRRSYHAKKRGPSKK